jgi:phosphomannomutase/phosphoglucomutase
VNPRIFRECDIRGVVGRDFGVDDAARIGRAFGTYVRRRGGDPRAIVGHDGRTTSPALYAAAVRGLTEAGCDVTAIGLGLTPMMYFAIPHFGAGAGVMVTASHNPPPFNGFKLSQGGGTLHGDQVLEVRDVAETGTFTGGTGRVGIADVRDAYMASLREKIVLGPRRLRVAVDCGNGTAGLFAPDILAGWGCDVVTLHCGLDPRFPHHDPDPADPRNLAVLSAEVRRVDADLGIAFDGDGDRLGAVDDRGGIVWGDVLMALFWREVLAAHPGAVALVEVKCSQALIDEIRRLGGRPEFTRTGHSLVKARMREVGAMFAGEMSGHMFFADEHDGYDDALYAAGRLLRMLSRTERTLSSLTAEIPRYHTTPEIRVACPDDRKFAVVGAVTRGLRGRYDVIEVDGARVVFPDGWALVRASNTQPALVVRAEAATPRGLERAKAVLERALRDYPEVAAVDWESAAVAAD